jgi:hypothetical protein
MYGRSHWNMISSHVASTERTFTVSDLLPATKYQLKVTAHNNAGSTTAIYDFTTLTAQGCKKIITNFWNELFNFQILFSDIQW